jgi:hypothetical protein
VGSCHLSKTAKIRFGRELRELCCAMQLQTQLDSRRF